MAAPPKSPRIASYFENEKLRYSIGNNVSLTIFSALIAVFLVIYVRYALKRKNYSSNRVTRRLRFLSPWGHIKDVVFSGKIKGVSLNVYFLQIIDGYRELFKQEGLFYFWIGFSLFVVGTKAKTVEELLSKSRYGEKSWMYSWLHPWLGTGLLTSNGSKWKSRRKLLTPSFHFDILKEFLPIFNEQSQVLVQQLEKESEKPWTDIVRPVTLCSLDIICETAFGVPIEAQKNSDSEYVQAISRATITIMKRVICPQYFFDSIFNLSPDGRQFNKDLKLLHDFTRSVIKNKKQQLLENNWSNFEKKRKAFLDLLLEHHIQNQTLTEEDIREEVDTFAFEGHDTTSMGLTWALYLIGLHQKVQERIHEELDRIFGDDYERHVTVDDLRDMEYLDRVLKESQRLYPSVPIFARNCNENTILSGTKVPKDSSFIISPYLLHRDETVFPNPEIFDPDRFLPENTVNRHPFAYIPFSAGPRNCIGQKFAVMEEKVVISNVLRNYIVESLDPRDKIMTEPGLILRPSDDIRMKFKSRRHLS